MENNLKLIIDAINSRKNEQSGDPIFEKRPSLFGSLPRERVIVNKSDPTAYKPVDPTTWSNEQLKYALQSLVQQHRAWMENNSGTLAHAIMGSPYAGYINEYSNVLNARTNTNRVLPPL